MFNLILAQGLIKALQKEINMSNEEILKFLKNNANIDKDVASYLAGTSAILQFLKEGEWKFIIESIVFEATLILNKNYTEFVDWLINEASFKEDVIYSLTRASNCLSVLE